MKRAGVHGYDLPFSQVSPGFTTSTKIDHYGFWEYTSFFRGYGYGKAAGSRFLRTGNRCLAGEYAKSCISINTEVVTGRGAINTPASTTSSADWVSLVDGVASFLQEAVNSKSVNAARTAKRGQDEYIFIKGVFVMLKKMKF